MLNAVRDNPERVEFVGYNTQRVRYIAFIIAGFFAGIAGGLAALNFEIVTAEVVGAARSGAYLLFTFLGGATFFFGPIIGAVLMVLALVLLSEFTKAWLLYLGLIFLFMVMYAPGGIASLIMMNLRRGGVRPAAPAVAVVPGAGAALPGRAGRRRGGADRDDLPPAARCSRSVRRCVSSALTLDSAQATPWIGARRCARRRRSALFEPLRRRFARRWGDVQSEIEARTAAAGAGMTRAADRQCRRALELRDVRKSFGKTEIIRGATLAVSAGERVAIIGPNGAGKSHAVQPDQRPLRRRPAARSCSTASASTA